MDTIYLSTREVLRFMVVFARVGGIMVFAPVFSARSVPAQIKIIFALVCSIAMMPAAAVMQIPEEPGIYAILDCAFGEILIGMVLGFVASMIFAAMQFAGQLISFNLGFAIINLIDPQSDVEVSVFGLLENYLGLIFFLLINGHHWFFLAVSDSFRYLPVQGVHLTGPSIQEIVRLSSQVLTAGVQIAAPVLAVTIICDVILGIIGRAAPQIQILIVGMPLKTLVGFTCLSISFYFLPQLLGRLFIQLYRSLFALMHSMA